MTNKLLFSTEACHGPELPLAGVDEFGQGSLAWVISPVLLTVEEAAGALRIGRTRMYGLLREGRVRSVKIGNSRRIPVDALHAYVKGLTEPRGPERRRTRMVVAAGPYDPARTATAPAGPETLEVG